MLCVCDGHHSDRDSSFFFSHFIFDHILVFGLFYFSFCFLFHYSSLQAAVASNCIAEWRTERLAPKYFDHSYILQISYRAPQPHIRNTQCARTLFPLICCFSYFATNRTSIKQPFSPKFEVKYGSAARLLYLDR